jgi:hypothetical protein
MTGSDGDGATAGPDADPFSVLGNETRLRIVDALYEQTVAADSRDGCSYSRLKGAAGVRDNGNFNYHLDVLRDRFVEKADEGYRLSFAGFEIAKSLRAGAWQGHEPREPVEIEASSPLVDGRPLYASYEESLVRVHAADEEPVFQIAVRPSGAAYRDLHDLADVMSAQLVTAVERAQRGVCPYCHAPPERSVERSPGEEPRHRFVADCPECGPLFEVPVGAAVARHPAVVSFYWARGVDVRKRRLWNLDVYGGHAVEKHGERTRLRIDRDRAALTLVLDEDGQVVDSTVEDVETAQRRQ